MAVFDIVTEGIKADFVGGEGDLRRAKEPRRIVDHANFAERCRIGQAR